MLFNWISIIEYQSIWRCLWLSSLTNVVRQKKPWRPNRIKTRLTPCLQATSSSNDIALLKFTESVELVIYLLISLFFISLFLFLSVSLKKESSNVWTEHVYSWQIIFWTSSTFSCCSLTVRTVNICLTCQLILIYRRSMCQLVCPRRMQTLLVARLAGFVERFHLLAPSGIPVTRVSDMMGGLVNLIIHPIYGVYPMCMVGRDQFPRSIKLTSSLPPPPLNPTS